VGGGRERGLCRKLIIRIYNTNNLQEFITRKPASQTKPKAGTGHGGGRNKLERAFFTCQTQKQKTVQNFLPGVRSTI